MICRYVAIVWTFINPATPLLSVFESIAVTASVLSSKNAVLEKRLLDL